MPLIKKLLLVCFAVCSVVTANISFAKIGEGSLLTDNIRRQLDAGKELRRYFRDGELPRMIPEVSYKKEILKKVRALNPTIGVEIMLVSPPSKQQQPPSGQAMLNALTAVRSLSGLSYYSTEKKKSQIFFEDAYPVGGPEMKQPVPKLVFKEGTKRSVLYARFDDDTLGQYNCRLQYRHDDAHISVEMENTTTMRFAIFPVAQPGKAQSFYLLMPHGDRYLFYGYTSVNTVNLFGAAESRKEDFYYRTKAVYQWMIDRMRAIDED